MTTPNAAEEFMRSLDQHPEIEQELRRRLLTQELLDLPNTVGTLASAISEMRDIFDRRLTLHLPQRWPWKNQFSGALPFPA